MERKKVEELWSHLHWLTVLAEQGTYTAAAARLQVSKAAMSDRIAELERAVGVPLVRRTTRSMRLTEAGLSLVAGVKCSFEDIGRSFAQAADLAGEPRGLVRVTAPVALARQHIVPMIADFLKRYPGIRVELDMSDRLSALSKDGFDIAIRHSANVPDTHVVWQLCGTESILIASPSYFERRSLPTTPSELGKLDCLHYPRGRQQVIWSLERGAPGTQLHQHASVQVSGPFAANNSEALRDAALAGLGIAMIPDFSAHMKLATGELVHVLPSWRAVGTFAERVLALRPYAAHVPRAVDLFVRHLRHSFGGVIWSATSRVEALTAEQTQHLFHPDIHAPRHS